MNFASAKLCSQTLSFAGIDKNRQKKNKQGETMNSDTAETVAAIKKEGLSVLMALGLMLVGGVMLAGAAWLYISPILNGESPNLVIVCLLSIPGIVIECIGDWKFYNVMEQTKRRNQERLERLAKERNVK